MVAFILLTFLNPNNKQLYMAALKSRWVLILLVIAFVILKIPALHYPFFWDESWSYAPGVNLMYNHGPSLMPNAIELYYSRGHPMLFYASAAAWMHIFGPSLISQHSFALFISVSLLISVYEISLRLFNKNAALLSLLLVGGQVIFFIQSTTLLPEVMVTLFSLLTLYCYATQKYWQTFLACTALVFTKESGMALGLVLGVHAVIYLFNKAATPAQKVKNLLPVLCAGLCIAGFYLVQKKVNGWYLFPEHTGLIDYSWQMFNGKMRYCAEIIFQNQCRSWLFLFFVTASVIVAITTRNYRFLIPVLTGILLYIFMESMFGHITRRLFIPFVFCSLVHSCYVLSKLDAEGKPAARRFIFLTLFFFGAYLSFSSLNFFSIRYLLCAIVVILMVVAWVFELFTRQIKRTFVFLFADCAIIVLCSFAFNNKIGDTEPGMFAAMRVQEDIVRYLENNKLYSKNISAHSALQRIHLTEPMTGFRHTADSFITVNYTISPATDFIIKDNIELDSADLTRLPPNGFKQVYQTEHGEAWGAIYGRK